MQSSLTEESVTNHNPVRLGLLKGFSGGMVLVAE